MKTVHMTFFGCNMTSEPLNLDLATSLIEKLEGKGMSCYLRDYIAQNGSRVRTIEEKNTGGWSADARTNCQWGIEGTVLYYNIVHKCYKVEHGGLIAFYHSSEIAPIN